MTDPRTIVTCTLTAAGAVIAGRLPYEHQSGELVATVGRRWREVDGFVLVGATGVAVRAIGPLLADKATDPAVVCVDDGGRWVIALTGGHLGGANDLAREVAGLLGAEAVVTTATDGGSIPGLDTLPGFRAAGDVAGVTRRWLDGAGPVVIVDPGLEAWPLPAQLDPNGMGPHSVRITDRSVPPSAAQVVLRPASLVLGVGSSSGADPGELQRLVAEALSGADLHPDAVGLVATVDRKAGEPAIRDLADAFKVALLTHPATALSAVAVPNPSAVVAAAVGTPSVAEAAALLAAGPGAQLVVEKQRSADATVAVARRARPAGHLAVVGVGPGDPWHRTPAATAALRRADVVIGYGPYLDLAADVTSPRQQLLRSPIGAETDRCRTALTLAATGHTVALVCSGDPGVYAMASLVCELAQELGDPPVTVIPGVTAALAGAAVLGAPLGHDHASVSLSDLLTDWGVVVRRVQAVAEADFVVSLYNPRSRRRTTQLVEALAILAAHRPAHTPAAVLTDIGRPGARVVRTTIAELDPETVDMLSLVMVGSSTTRWIGQHMVTPRGLPAMTVAVATNCTACGACLATCPTRALIPARYRPVVVDDRCTDCLACLEVCPVDAIAPRPNDDIHPIEIESYRILHERVDLDGWAPGPRDVVARMIHASADESFAETTRIGSGAVAAAVAALRASAPVICDSRMVVAGVPSVPNTACFLDEVATAAPGDTRSAGAIRLAATRHPTGALWVIGNAPTALAQLLRLHAAGSVEPAAVIGLPVGYVGAAEAKAALWDSDLQVVAITNAGQRGGSPVAAAALNALHRMAGRAATP